MCYDTMLISCLYCIIYIEIYRECYLQNETMLSII